MKLESVLEEFREYLLLNYRQISLLLSDELVDDWLQTNWELLVEFRLQDSKITTGLIDIYGNGADCNGAGSRVTLPRSYPTCSIHIATNCIFHSFGTSVDGFFMQEPPFDYVKGECPKSGDLILPLNKAKFTIGKTYDELAT